LVEGAGRGFSSLCLGEARRWGKAARPRKWRLGDKEGPCSRGLEGVSRHFVGGEDGAKGIDGATKEVEDGKWV
jgi:hypothetical protein